ncbi:UNVERIFIED_CONTAM: hypothetical protein Sradi_4547500 [Sesamum radiatum]|uniref:Uncharacterized protein n=1 Tax=Sesamum radiatum TaxID=300843 RepID=A0AAW2N8K2_SESRA
MVSNDQSSWYLVAELLGWVDRRVEKKERKSLVVGEKKEKGGGRWGEEEEKGRWERWKERWTRREGGKGMMEGGGEEGKAVGVRVEKKRGLSVSTDFFTPVQPFGLVTQ